MQTKELKYILVILFIVCIISIPGQPNNKKIKEIGKTLINYFSPKTYKSGPRNWSIAQDNRGVMYFGNESGVLEYDGNFWRKIEVPGNQTVRSITSDKNGRIYVCASTDFGYLAPDSIGQLKFNSLLPLLDEKYKQFGEVWDVETSSHGAFFKTKKEIFKWDGSKITVWDSVFAFRLYNINDTIYSRNDGIGLMQIDNDKLKLTPGGEFFASIGIYDILPFKKNEFGKTESILVTTNSNGIFIQEDDKFIPFKTEADDYLMNNQIYHTKLTSNNNYVFATQRGGVVVVNKIGKLQKIVNELSGLNTNVCFDIYSDSNNGLWIASDYGISYLKESSSISIFKNSGMLKNIAYSVRRKNNRLYATNELGVLIWEGESKGFQLIKGSHEPAFTFGEFNDQLFVGTSSGTHIVEEKSLGKTISKASARFICASKVFPNRMYLATYEGLMVVEKINDTFVEVFEKEFSDESIKIVEEDNGSLWIYGFFPELIRITGELKDFSNGEEKNIKYGKYDKSNGFEGSVLNINKIREGIIITTDVAVYIFDEISISFQPFNSFDNFLSDSTNSVDLIETTKNDDLWILAYLDNNPALGKADRQKEGTYIWKQIPELQRIDLESISAIYSESDPFSGNENVWISTQEGLYLYNGISEKNILEDYKTLLRKVTVKGDSLIYAGTQSLETNNDFIIDYEFNDISFEYSAIQFDKPNSTYFQTYLEGDEDDWSDWSLETKKDFTNLSQGEYKFHVKSKNIYGVVSHAEPFAFSILPPWYLSLWAYLSYIILIGGTLFSIRRIELNRREKNNRLKMIELKAEAAEFQAKAAESQARLIQADNDRKTRELEEARDLQISMLPKNLPDVENLDIEVFMQTATEVGGDYYDFSIKDDGSLNIALGDATGHGMKAGTLVSMMKSLFAANSIYKNIDQFFYSSNNALKNSKLDRMMMAFGMINIKRDELMICNAGIPPIFIYRKEKAFIEEVKVNGLPFGALKNSNYEVYNGQLKTGDVILIFSDGMPEIQNRNEEMYGYERLRKIFKKIAEKASKEIISELSNESKSWLEGNNPEDDITFVVIKVV